MIRPEHMHKDESLNPCGDILFLWHLALQHRGFSQIHLKFTF